MRVNGIDIRTFKAKQLTVEVQPPSTAVKYDWNDGDLKPNTYKTEDKAGTLNLTLYFVGKDRTEVHRNISEFLEQLNDAAVLDLEGYKGSYYGIKKSVEIEKTKEHRKKKLNVEFDGYFFDQLIEKELSSGAQEYVAQGSRDAPCILNITNKTNTTKTVTVSGLTDTDIEVNVPGKTTLVIDGDIGTVTIDGENAFGNVVTMWEFPRIRPGRNMIGRTELPRDVEIIMQYRPMWLI